MDEELENFIRERKARVAEDKASLEQDPPYMELKTQPQRAYAVKENIPPKVQGEEDGCNVGLPLGLEYEKKKQRLQRELRMDYRHYIAQKTQGNLVEVGPLSLSNTRRLFKHPLERRAAVIPHLRPPSRRDAATLTEDSRGLNRAPREDRACSPQPDRDCTEQLVDQDSDEARYNMEFMERVHRANTAGKNRTNKTDREKRDILYGKRSKSLFRKEEEEFTTGLMIGAANTEEVLQKKKERYRKELQEQIAEQHRNKKREKELELKVAATGANDPEKPLDRIRQFGLHRRKENTATVESDLPSAALPSNKTGIVDKETPLPVQPQVVFQSPVLDYSSALGLGGAGGMPYPFNQPAAPSYPRPVDAPRISLYPPHPPSSLSEPYRSPPYEPHHYYVRNPTDPQTPYYGQLAVPGGGHVPYWNVPPGGAVSSQNGNHSPHSQHSGSSFPEPPMRPSNEVETADSRAGRLPPERSARERILSYREALKQQIQEHQERRFREREEKERYEAKLVADMKNHEPWGRGGGGAPLRDSTGNLIADLNQMHKLNEEAYIHPEQWQRRATAALTARRTEQPDPNERVSGTVTESSIHDANDRLAGFTHVESPQFGRGNVFSNQPTQQQLQEQDKYKAYLKQQIEEKLRKKAEEREQIRLEEEKEEKRLAEQRARIQREYEEEQDKKKRKEQEQKAKNEELIQLAEQKKKEAERKKKEAEEKETEVLKKQYEKERQARVEEVYRELSPPIPTHQKKPGFPPYTPRPPTVESQQSIPPLSERSLSGLQSPPVPARRNQLRAAGDRHDVFNELSALRRQLRTQQRRLEGHLQQDDWDDLESPLSDRRLERPQVDVFDMARLRLQAPVRRPSSRNAEPRNLLQIHDSLQLKYNDAESRLGSGDVPKVDAGAAGWRMRDYRDQYPFNSQRSTVQDDYFDLSPPRQNEYLRSVLGRSSRGSLLDSESAFIDPFGDAFPVPLTPELNKGPPLSARERRRLAKQQPQDQASSSHKEDYLPHAEGRLQHQNQVGTGRQGMSSRRGNTGPLDFFDRDSPPQFGLRYRDQSSVETGATNTWRRLGTSDTLTCLDRPMRRERLVT